MSTPPHVQPSTASQLLRLKRLREQTTGGDAKRLREEARLSQPEIGSVVGVPPSTISVWENGKRIPRGAAALRYAYLLDQISDSLAEPVESEPTVDEFADEASPQRMP